MSSDTVAKSVGKKLRYYFEVKRLEDGFDLSGVNAPQLNHPPLKSRPTLQYDGLHDRALKHYFSQPEVRTKITQLLPNEPQDQKEEYTKKLVNRYMYKHRFILQESDPLLDLSVLKPKKIVGYHLNIDKLKDDPRNRRYAWQSNSPKNKKHPTMPQWMYKHHPTEGKSIKPEFLGFGVGLKKRRKSIKGGYPLLRSVPSHNVTKGEAHRLIDVATKILIATEKVNELQSRPTTPCSKRQTAPQPFETDKPLPSHTGKKKKRPSTAKFTWDIHGRRHVRVKDRDTQSADGHKSKEKRRAYDDSFIPDWLLKQDRQRSPPRSPERTPTRTPSPKPSPRPKSAKFRQRDPVTVINVPEAEDKEEVRVNEGTQTADTVGIQTEKRLLEEYDHTEDEVTSGPWVEYQLYVQTGDRVGASTRADVRVTLYGEHGRTREMTLEKSSRNKVKFQRGKEDVFLVAAHDVGKLRKIRIGHDRPELTYAWYLDSVSVYNMNEKKIYDFPCNAWLSGQDEAKKTYQTLELELIRNFVDTYDDVRESKSLQVGKDSKAKTASTESRHSKDDKRSLESLRGSRGGYHSDSDTSSSSLSSTISSSSSGSRRGRKTTTAPRAKTPTQVVREVSPARQPAKDEFFDTKAGPTFTFKSFNEDGNTAEEEYLTGYKAGLNAAANGQKVQEEEQDAERKRVLTGPSIHDAARQGNLERMQTLISYYPEMKESKDESGLTPLHIATQQGRLEIVKWLTALGINLNTETRTGYTAIHLAAMNGHLNCLIVLFAMGATLTCRSVDRQTPLHVAAMNGHLECVKWLIANRSSMDAEDQLGRSPLDLAEEYQHTAVADFIRKCMDESHDPSSSLHALRSSRKGLGTIEEDRSKESTRNDGRWLNDTNPDSARANADSDSEGRDKRKKSHDSMIHLEERRRVYERQHEQMNATGTSFLDSIRDEATH